MRSALSWQRQRYGGTSRCGKAPAIAGHRWWTLTACPHSPGFRRGTARNGDQPIARAFPSHGSALSGSVRGHGAGGHRAGPSAFRSELSKDPRFIEKLRDVVGLYISPVDHKRHGTTTLFAALDVATGECLPRHRHQEFLRFIRRVERESDPDLELHFILDNYASIPSSSDLVEAPEPFDHVVGVLPACPHP